MTFHTVAVTVCAILSLLRRARERITAMASNVEASLSGTGDSDSQTDTDTDTDTSYIGSVEEFPHSDDQQYPFSEDGELAQSSDDAPHVWTELFDRCPLCYYPYAQVFQGDVCTNCNKKVPDSDSSSE